MEGSEPAAVLGGEEAEVRVEGGVNEESSTIEFFFTLPGGNLLRMAGVDMGYVIKYGRRKCNVFPC